MERDERRERAKRDLGHYCRCCCVRVSSKESGRKVLFMIGFARGVGGAKGIGSASRIYRKSSKLPRNLSQSEMSFLLLCYLSAFQAQESPEPVFDLSECALKNVPSGVYSRCKVSRKEGLLLQVSERANFFLLTLQTSLL